MSTKQRQAPRYISLNDATEKLRDHLGRPKLSRRTVEKWIKDGLLKARKTRPVQQGRVLVLESSVEKFLTRMPSVA